MRERQDGGTLIPHMFVTNADNGTTVAETIRNLAKKSTRMDFLVGYFSIDGFAEIYESIGDKPIRILVGMNVTGGDDGDDYFGGRRRRNNKKRQEDAEKAERAERAERAEKAAKAVLFLAERAEKGQLEIRKTRRSNHSKMYLFSFQRVGAEGDHGRVLMGSSNLSRRGLLARAEMNVVLASDSFDRALKAFEDFWRVATPITPGRDATPLGWANVFNNMAAVRKLLEKNINTELWVAAYRGDLNAVTLLIEKGASVNTETEGGVSALIVAMKKGYWSIAELLIEKGANVNVGDNVGDTALLVAIHNDPCNLYIAKLLIERGADVNVETEKGWTALMFMASNMGEFSKEGSLDVAKLLIKKGADINAKNKNGWTALMIAELRGNKEIVELLRGYGAKTQTNYSSSHITKPSTDENYGEVYFYMILGVLVLALFLWISFRIISHYIFD